MIGPLTDPVAHGGSASDAFHIVAPSLPGFGFSDKPKNSGWGVTRIAAAWIMLMARLGYDRWVAQGGDWGSAVTTAIGGRQPGDLRRCSFEHATDLSGTGRYGGPYTSREGLSRVDRPLSRQGTPAMQSSRRPGRSHLATASSNSPAGQAAWIYEKMWAWTDNQDAPEDALTLDEIPTISCCTGFPEPAPLRRACIGKVPRPSLQLGWSCRRGEHPSQGNLPPFPPVGREAPIEHHPLE